MTNYSDLRFLEKIKHPEKKNYDKGQNLVAAEFDISLNQTNKKTINKVNREKNTNYKYLEIANRKRIEDFTGEHIRPIFYKKTFDSPLNNAEEIFRRVMEVNTYEEGLIN